MKPKAIIIPTLVLFLVCLGVTAALAGTNLLTKPIIEELNIETAKQSRQQVLPEAAEFEEASKDDVQYHIGKDASGAVVGYVFTNTSNSGYGGAVEVMTGINAEGSVSGVVILSHNETPGLGANAEKESFRDQYLQAAPQEGFNLIKSGNAGDGQILAMTGATITSNAVTEAVNQSCAQYYTVKEGA